MLARPPTDRPGSIDEVQSAIVVSMDPKPRVVDGISYFLNMLDGLRVTEGVLVIATSNYPERLDPALLHRPSRFDRVWRFPLPDLEQRRRFLTRKGGTFFSELALERTAKATKGFSMAYLQEIIVNSMLAAMRDEVEPTDKHLHHSVQALQLQRKAVSKVEDSLIEHENIGFVGVGMQTLTDGFGNGTPELAVDEGK